MTQTKSALKGVRIMMPYDTYRLYQAERVKSSVEIQRADMQAARLVSAVASLFRSIMRPVRAVRRLGPSAVRGSLSAPQVVGTEWLSFQRIVDVPFETCVAALDSWQRAPGSAANSGSATACSAGQSSTMAIRARTGSRSAWPGEHCARCCA